MDRREIVKLDVAFVYFKPQMGSNTNVQVEEIVDMDEEELQNREDSKHFAKYLIGPPAFNHFMWYAKSLKLELKSIGPERKLRVTHFRVESGIRGGFLFGRNFYHNFTVIVGPIEEHFYFVDAVKFQVHCGRRFRPHLQALAQSRVLAVSPQQQQKCPPDFCANNCNICRSSPTRTFCPCNGKSFEPPLTGTEIEN
ncbi:uncharacterized protein LOC129792319 [Lutzomyia longipalpis]|uniref:uncharacterized protein LOC129792319 n=1 Tax=Lutzomyia longipalpis TaxID=7200 RepID=UPI0024845100|nr:uncharacterized protein LOC129792319 [Lutzomyia longipalpis]